MGIGLGEVDLVWASHRLEKKRGLYVLDIGCSNVYGGVAEEFESFLVGYGGHQPSPELSRYCALMERGGGEHAIAGGVNGSWLGDLLERAGNSYVAYDLFPGFNTHLFDLNFDDVPSEHQGLFDLVINCGTTEHVLNQFNCMEVIHDATKVGGLIFHTVPMIGYLDHGYFNYKPRLLFELADANGYEILYVDYTGPSADHRLADEIVAPYAARNVIAAEEVRTRWRSHTISDGALRVLLQKKRDAPFRTSNEVSTALFGSSTFQSGAAIEWHTRHRGAVENPLHAPIGDLVAAYNDYRMLRLSAELPTAMERRLIEHFLSREPGRDDLRQRLIALDTVERDKAPLSLLEVPAPAVPVVKMDGREGEIGAIGDGEERYRQIVFAHNRYLAEHRRDFPLLLEQEALAEAMSRHPENYHLAVRLGAVLTALTQEVKLPDTGYHAPVAPRPRPRPTQGGVALPWWRRRYDPLTRLPSLPSGLRWRWVLMAGVVVVIVAMLIATGGFGAVR